MLKLILLTCLVWSFGIGKITCLVPPKFQWKSLDFAWESPEQQEEAISSGSYISQNNMPTGVARWKDKVFITIPRWRKGVPSTLNYISLNGAQNQSLIPYPSWEHAYVKDDTCCLESNSTVVSTFRVNVDSCNRLWVVDNGAADMSGEVKQITEPAIVLFDLNTDKLIYRYPISPDVLKEASVLTSIVVDVVKKSCDDTYAYIADMGSNALIVFSLKTGETWRVEHHYFCFDPHAGTYKVGGVDFYWRDGVSALALGNPQKDGNRELFLYPTSSTRQFKINTRLLRDKDVSKEKLFHGVEVIGDRGPNTQSTACDFDPVNEVLFYTQLCKNGLACWHVDKPFDENNTPLLISDCQMLEFPNDVKIDHDGNVWILSDRKSRFLHESMDFDQVNFRVLSAPTSHMIQGTPCEGKKGKESCMGRVMSKIKRKKSK